MLPSVRVPNFTSERKDASLEEYGEESRDPTFPFCPCRRRESPNTSGAGRAAAVEAERSSGRPSGPRLELRPPFGPLLVASVGRAAVQEASFAAAGATWRIGEKRRRGELHKNKLLVVGISGYPRHSWWSCSLVGSRMKM